MILGHQEGGRAGDLGQAVDLHETAAESGHRVRQHPVADRRSAVGNQLQRAVIARLCLGGLQHEQDHRRHQKGVGDAVLADRIDETTGVEVGVRRTDRAAVQREQRHVGAGDVKGRQRIADHAALAHLPDGDAELAVEHQPGM